MNEFQYLEEHFIKLRDVRIRKEVFRKSVTDVIIELFSFCNRNCPYCPNSIFDRRGENYFLPGGIIEKIINNLQEIGFNRNICLNLYNEPLAEREYIIDKIKMIRKKLPDSFIYLSSNGDYITRDYLVELSVSGLNKLYVTLHPASNEEYDDLLILNRMSAFSHKINVPLKYKVFIPGHFISSETRAGNIVIEIFSNNYRCYGQDRGGLLTNITNKEFVRTMPCIRPFTNFTIAYDGSVLPCCQIYQNSEKHNKYIVSNLSEAESIFEVYSGDFLSRWRLGLLTYGPKEEPCNTCTEVNINEKGSAEDIKKREDLYNKFIHA